MPDITVELVTWSFAPTPGEDLAARVFRLRSSGAKVVEIAKDLDIAERHAYRLLAEAKSRNQDALYSPFSLVDAVSGGRATEEIAYLFQSSDEVAWSRGAAKYAWSVYSASPSLSPGIVEAFSIVYYNLSFVAPEDLPRRAYVVDLALRLMPWEDDEAQFEYLARVPITNDDDDEFVIDILDYLKSASHRYEGSPDLSRINPDQAERLSSLLAERESLARDAGSVRLVKIPGTPKRRKRR